MLNKLVHQASPKKRTSQTTRFVMRVRACARLCECVLVHACVRVNVCLRIVLEFVCLHD